MLAAALREFSQKGLHGGSTTTIAAAAGISQPNLFRLFATKKELFIAVLTHVFEAIEREMIQRGASAPDPLTAMESAWGRLLVADDLMAMYLQGFAACHDPDIRVEMQRATRAIFERVERMPGLDAAQAHRFFAEGLLFMAGAVMNLEDEATEDGWGRRFLYSG
ncbi:TetR/AcrR family transcriptional regulator [Streptosporangium sp. NBC_01755]|uniref:TetR/AcrR family transcriptional regulator n=1 Tax=unclassified Streptosporangium TaxID=2632669 RepID=UPI002DDC49CF|nr:MULTISPECIES: helix-turn-helix domain-containing protein [unclassified Streptosporangium]WSA28111.1 TetR/AcrR family transcriptional regulator [Streptosporangium sp. NBC_01810]WSD00417.1 TetR/AcrR family transcriptional regulator [Streptosporangium sp. NBC_01755]